MSNATDQGSIAPPISTSKGRQNNGAATPPSNPDTPPDTTPDTTPGTTHTTTQLNTSSRTSTTTRSEASQPTRTLSSTFARPVTTAPTIHSTPSIARSTNRPSQTSIAFAHTTTTLVPTATSTVTDAPDSTFSSPVAITLTNPNNGNKVCTPPFVTLLSTSTESDGSFVTWTHVVANPTQTNPSSDSSKTFLQKPGALAGVFLVVGIVAASLILCLLYFIRRFRRTRRQSQWLATLQELRSEGPEHPNTNPFADPDDSPPMRSVDEVHNDFLHRNVQRHVSAPYGMPGYHTENLDTPAAGAEIQLNDGTRRIERLAPIGISFPMTGLYSAQTSAKPASIAESTPSIYPATLPQLDDRTDGLQEITQGNLLEQRVSYVENPSDEKPFTSQSEESYIVDAPPRPPRSRLRDLTSKTYIGESLLLTPPVSVYSEELSSPVSRSNSLSDHSPVKGTQAIIGRRTLLDVRPRASLDNLGRLRHGGSSESSSNGHP